MANTTINSTQSTAPTRLPEIVVSAPSSGGPTDPNKTITDNQTGLAALVYPSDRPKYFMRFDVLSYSRRSLQTVGTMTPATGPAYKDGNSIVLPLASHLEDLNHVRWDDREIGFGPGALTDTAFNFGRGNNQNGALNGAGFAGGAALNALPGGFSEGTQALLGMAPNKFMTILFIGPAYKRHQFQWLLSPNNKDEAETIRKIIKTFNNAAAPNTAGGGLIFTFPKIFKISFNPNSKYMYKFKPAVLEDFSVDFTPNGRAAFHIAPAHGENPPAMVNIRMKFIEIEYWLEGNFNDSNDPFDIYSTVPAENQSLDAIRQQLLNFNNAVQEAWKKNFPNLPFPNGQQKPAE